MESTPIVSIIGPTASGKSGLAMKLASAINGEIICADSRTVYTGMDIGTAKPSTFDRATVPHHILDLIEPGTSFSAAEFKGAAGEAIADISVRGTVPFVVGGTGLYVYGLLYDYQFPAGARSDERSQFEFMSTPDLAARLMQEDPEMAAQIDLKNPRRVIRALETIGQPRQKTAALKSNILLIGLNPKSEQLNTQIAQRTKAMIQIGLVDEVQYLIQTYGAECEAFRSPGYAEIIDFITGKTSLSEAEELINLHTRQLVRRQLTWFKRNSDIQWFETEDDAYRAVTSFLFHP